MTQDYYKVLGLDLDATEDEIRRSFRRLAKKHHPDMHRGNTARAERATRLLIQAYKTLMDRSERMIHDARIRSKRSWTEDSFLTRMRRRRNDPAAQTRLVLYCLLHDRTEEALATYERIRRDLVDYDSADHLDGRDHFDFLFLIAESYECRDQPAQAATVYERLFRNGNGSRNGSFYHVELQERLRTLYLRTLPHRSSPREALRYYRRGLKIDLPRRDEAFAHKKMAECYFACNDLERARERLDRALELMPKLKGIKKISEKLAAAQTGPTR